MLIGLPNDESVDEASWSEMVAGLLDEAEDDDVPEPEDPEHSWQLARGFAPEAVF